MWQKLARSRVLNTAVGMAALVGTYATKIEPRWLRVSRYTLEIPDLPAGFNDYRITHLSDLHLSVPMNRRNLSWMVAVANRTLPDLMVITGDFATHGYQKVEDRQGELEALRANDGVWACWGNHDYYVGPEKVRPLLNQAGIKLLNNAHHVLHRKGERLVLAGIDDAMWGRPNLSQALKGVPDDASVILLAHEPGSARYVASDPRVKLQLSGHTHGGQIRVPGLGPLVLPALSRPFVWGAYQIEGLALYVTAGTGTGQFVMRFACRPEVTVITLRRGAADRATPVWRSASGRELQNDTVFAIPSRFGIQRTLT